MVSMMKYDGVWVGTDHSRKNNLKERCDAYEKVWERNSGQKWNFEIPEIIRSTRRTVDVVFPDLSTNKILLFMHMWHYLVIFINFFWGNVIFIFLFLVLIRKLTRTFAYICINDILLVKEDYINSPPDVNNDFSPKTRSVYTCIFFSNWRGLFLVGPGEK